MNRVIHRAFDRSAKKPSALPRGDFNDDRFITALGLVFAWLQLLGHLNLVEPKWAMSAASALPSCFLS